MQAYSFTSAPIAKALVVAHKRGVKASVVLDRSQRSERYSSADFVNNVGISTYIDAKHAIAHNKIMIIDGATLITGSFDFTKVAEEKNAENHLELDVGVEGEEPRLGNRGDLRWIGEVEDQDPPLCPLCSVK